MEIRVPDSLFKTCSRTFNQNAIKYNSSIINMSD